MRLVLVAPYLCYMRQDTAFHEGEAISQKVIGPLLARYVDRVITVDAHLHRTPDIGAVFPGIESDNLSAMPAISDTLRKAGLDPMTVVAGPDAESLPWASDLAGRLGLSYTVAQKTRRGDRSVAIAFQNPACIAGRPALIVDTTRSSRRRSGRRICSDIVRLHHAWYGQNPSAQAHPGDLHGADIPVAARILAIADASTRSSPTAPTRTAPGRGKRGCRSSRCPRGRSSTRS